MIQYYLDIKKQLTKVTDKNLSYGQIQKIYSTSYYLSLTIRSPGKSWHLYLGRGNGFEGVWLGEKAPESILRRKDNFLEYFRRHLSACSFIDLEQDQHDRIIKINYQKFGKVQSLLMFWMARKLYFVHHYQEAPEAPFRLLLSWKGKSEILPMPVENLFECFDEVGRSKEIKHEFSSREEVDILDLLNQEKEAASLKGFTSSPHFLQRKITNIQGDLAKAKQWKNIQALLDSGDDLNQYEMRIEDQKIKFHTELNQFERRNLLFEKIKKLKRGEKILTSRLEETENLLKEKKPQQVSESKLVMNKPIWGKDLASKSNVNQAKIVEDSYKVFKRSGYSIGVGLNSIGNDQLRNKWASKEDLWIHLDGLKSSHVIIKLHEASQVTPDMLQEGAEILAQFSHFSDSWIPIIHTQVKNLKGVSGSAGMVIYKKEKHLKCPRVDLSELLKE